ncbi:hypothetical protein [Streptosporangium sp. NPDC000239]|uniref:hypothetical protein n=1 Tax=unclassified Streptosporangium TaxID=2632669 RepID=UPI00331EA456
MTDDERRLISLLISTHPGWRYERHDLPGLPRWWAIRYALTSMGPGPGTCWAVRPRTAWSMR